MWFREIRRKIRAKISVKPIFSVAVVAPSFLLVVLLLFPTALFFSKPFFYFATGEDEDLECKENGIVEPMQMVDYCHICHIPNGFSSREANRAAIDGPIGDHLKLNERS